MTLDLRGINFVLKADTQGGVFGINAATEALKKADAAAASTSRAFLQFGKNGELTARQMQALSYQTTDIFTSLASGQSPFLVLLQQGGQLRDQFGSVGNVMRAFAASMTLGKVAAIGFGAAVVGAAVAVLQGANEIDDFNKRLALTGNVAALNKTQFDAMAATIAGASNNTIGRAKDSLLELAGSGRFSAATMVEIGRAALVMQKLTGESVVEITKRLAQMGSGVSRWAAENNRAYNYVSGAQLEYYRTLEAQGRLDDAARANAKDLADTLQTRLTPAVNGLQLSLQIGQRWWDAFWQAAKGAAAPETIEDRLRKANEALERRSQGGGFFFGGNSFGAAAEQQFSLSKQVARQFEIDARVRDELLKNQAEVEALSKAHQDALLRIGQAGSQLALAQQQAAFDARAAATDRAYRQFEISAEQFRERMIEVERGRVEAERRDVLAQIDIEGRRVFEGTPEQVKQQQLARDAALLGLQTKLVQVEAKRAQVNREIAEYKRAAASPRDIVEGPQAAFRAAEIAQQNAAEAALRERSAEAQKAAADILATNQGLSVALIQDDRARGQAQIAAEAEQLRRRAQLYATTAEQRRAVDDAVAEYTRLREQQLTEQLKPEWQKQLDLYADTTRHMAKSFDDAMNTATRASEDAWVDMVAKGEFSAKRLVQVVNEQLARIGWQKFLAEPAANLWQQFFGAIFGGATGSAASPYGTGLGSRLGHSGGIVGGDMGGGAVRTVNPLLFAGARRYHAGGLAGGEVPAILQRGEEVLTRRDPRHRMNGGAGGVTINANFYPADGQSPAAYAAAVGPQLRQLKAELIGEMARPGTAAHAAARR